MSAKDVRGYLRDGKRIGKRDEKREKATLANNRN
jgi:hypothetical protein